MLKIIQTSYPYDEIKLSFLKNKVNVTFMYQGKPVAEMSQEYYPYCDIHLTQLEGVLRAIPQ